MKTQLYGQRSDVCLCNNHISFCLSLSQWWLTNRLHYRHGEGKKGEVRRKEGEGERSRGEGQEEGEMYRQLF